MPGPLYYPIYLLVIVVMTIYQCLYYRQTSCNVIERREKVLSVSSLFGAIVVTFFIGLRPRHSCFVDMLNYIAFYDLLQDNVFLLNFDAENLIFDNLFAWMASNGYHWSNFFLLIALIYFVGMWMCCVKMFPRDTMLAFLVCLGGFSTFSYGTNGIKAGAAASLFLIALSNNDNWKIAVAFLALSLGFHHSMTLPIAAYFLAFFYCKPKYYFNIWILSFIIAALHITYFQHLFGNFTDERGAEYLTATDWGTRIGFRIDFIIYSAMPVIIGYWALYKKQLKSKTYEFILSVYLLTNSVWMLCMYANFTNRIAYLSWFMYPVVLIYPFFEKGMGNRRYKMLATVAFMHVMFTVFMQVVYYG